MNYLTVLCILVGWLGAGCATKQPRSPPVSSPDRFVGAWRLVSWTSTIEGQIGFPYGPDARGLLLYTAAGRMSVFLSQPSRLPFARSEAVAGTSDEKVVAFDSCFAYAGTYEVAEGRVSHRIEHCTFPNWVGTEQVRFFRFEGDRLVLETPPLAMNGREAASRLTWERAIISSSSP